MRDNTEPVWFGMIDGFAVDLLLETSYIHRCIRYILPMERRIVLVQFKPVAAISVIEDVEYAKGVETVPLEKESRYFCE